MLHGLWKIGIGLTFIVCGLNGELVVTGTQNSGAVAVIGGVFLLWGLVVVVSEVRAELGASPRSRRTTSRGSRGTRSPPSWMPTRRRR